MDPTGSYVATANGPSNDACLFTYDGGLGSATLAATVTGLADSIGAIFHPDQNTPVVYFANTGASPGSSTIAAFTYSGATLTPLAGSPFATSTTLAGPSGMAIK